MYTKLKPSFFVYLILLLFFSACVSTKVQLSPEGRLAGSSQKTWRLNQKTTNGSDFTQDCDLDDKITFYADGRLEQNVTTIKCNEEEQNVSGNWLLKGTAKDTLSITLIVADLPFTVDYKIEELSSNRLIFSFKQQNIETGSQETHQVKYVTN